MSVDESRESFLTVAEVAEILRLNPQTVRNWIDAGTLPATRVGRRVRIKQSDLDLIVARGYRGAPPASVSTEGLSADDFWGGEPSVAAEPSFSADAPQTRAETTPETPGGSPDPEER